VDVRTCKIQKNTAEVKNACGSVRLTTLPCGSVRVRTQEYGLFPVFNVLLFFGFYTLKHLQIHIIPPTTTICRVPGAIIGAVCLTSLHRS